MQTLLADDPATIASAYHRGEGVPGIAAHYGIPNETLTDHGTQFASNQSITSNHVFGRFLEGHTIRHIVARRNHPQANGGTGQIDRLITAGCSMDNGVDWQNRIKSHARLNYKEPATVFFERLPPEQIFGCARRRLGV